MSGGLGLIKERAEFRFIEIFLMHGLFKLPAELGRRSKEDSAVKNFNKDLAVAEGVKTSLAVHLLAEKLGVEMPICASVYEVIHKGCSATISP